MTKNILIAEDDEDIVGLLRLYLEKDGYKVISVDNGEDAFKIVKNSQISLALLDIMMPKMNGYELTKKIREITNIPIIILSAKTLDSEKILGLDLGADDYLAKPFGMMEMVSRVRAVLRRSAKETHVEKEMKLGSISLIPNRHEVYVDNQKIDLTLKEYELLKLLMTYPGIVFTREQLLNSIWGTEYDGETRTVDVHVRTLRQKLGDAQNHISTIRGVGYRFEENITYD